MMWRIDKMEQAPTSILSAERCHLGEGPTGDAATDTAWWFDILEGRLFEAHLGNGQIRSHLLGRMASALGCIGAKRQLIAAEDALYIRSVANRSMTLYRPLESDNRLTRSNDAWVHPSGTFWIGTMGRKAQAGAGAINARYRGEISQLFPRISIPNAICFSSDGALGYFADTATHVPYRVVHPATGLPCGAPEKLLQHRGVGGLDGAVFDADGRIWNARWAVSMSAVRKGSICAVCAYPRARRAASSVGLTLKARPPETEFLDAETGRQKSPLKRTSLTETRTREWSDRKS
jgi:sugar lactone lactonase